ncbi:type I secretion protein [bacterium]|nr:type I secretion protein [bacterium]
MSTTCYYYTDFWGKQCLVDSSCVTQHSDGCWYDDKGHQCYEKLDGIVSGTSGNDLIDYNYTGDPQGDMIDHNDQILSGAQPNDDLVYAYGGNDTVLAGAGNDIVYGGDGHDSLNGGYGNDTQYGDAGNDTLVGAAGSNTSYGGSGDDRFVGGVGADSFFGGTGQDNLDYTASASGVTVNLSTGVLSGGDAANDHVGGGIDGVYGSNYGDSLTGFDDQGTTASDTYTNQFYGNGGNDSIYGMGGNDQLYGGNDHDLIYGGSGDDTVDGGQGNDTLYGDAGNDHVIGGQGSDLEYGGDGNDTISDNSGNDTIFGGAGNDVLDIGGGGANNDLVHGDEGDDTLFGGAGNDTLFGDAGNDLIYGGTGNDSLDGGAGNDTVFGSEGNDQITGGAGADSLYGSNGADYFHGGSAGDFVDGGEGGPDHDTLDLTGSGPVHVIYDPTNSENGTVQFLDATDHHVTGTMTFQNIENVIPCFTPGTLIATPRGEVPVESLRAGDRVITRDNGMQEIAWVGRRDMGWTDLVAAPHLKPILVRAGSLGNGLPEQDMIVSPNHRLLVANDRTALYFDEHEVLVAAKHLVSPKGVQAIDAAGVSYIHFMCERHEVVLSNGAWTETFQPGDFTLKGMGNAQRGEIFELFPELKTETGLENYVAARKTLKRHEAALLVR